MKKKFNIVIDTNVIIAAVKSIKGASALLLDLLSRDRIKAHISVPLFLEYEEILRRETSCSEEQLSVLLSFLAQNTIRHDIFFLYRNFIQDPDDAMILELAIKSNSEYIITFNTKDFRGCERFGIHAITPKELLIIIGEIK